MAKPTVCLALTGLLATESDSRGRIQPGSARVGAKEFTRRLAKSFNILVLLPRITINPDRDEESQREAFASRVKQWLAEYHLWYDGLTWDVPVAAIVAGPRAVVTALNPTHDDFIQAEREIRTRLAELG